MDKAAVAVAADADGAARPMVAMAKAATAPADRAVRRKDFMGFS